MAHVVTSVRLTIDANETYSPHVYGSEPDRGPGYVARYGASLYAGDHNVAFTFNHGYETAEQIIARIDNLAAGLDAMRAAVLAFADTVPIEDTPMGIEDDVAGEAVTS